MSEAFKKFIERRESQIRGKSGGMTWLWVLLGIACAAVLIWLVIRGNLDAGPINPNTATAERLQTLDGIGPEIAEKILAGRPYSSLDDLKKVKGIGDVTFERIRPKLTLEEK
jgi:competence ComEA-like helix-hairpin-helix protein